MQISDLHPIYESVINNYFDYYHDETRKVILSVNETDQSKVLSALTTKLYDKVVAKVDDIDFGQIPLSKGDITKIPNYEQLCETIDLIKNILITYNQKTESIDTISTALNYMNELKDSFIRAYKFNLEMPMVIYNTIALSIVTSTSLLISSTIEFIKSPNSDAFEISIDRVSLVKTQSNLLFSNLKKFNKLCASGEMEKTIEFIISKRVKNLTGVIVGVGATITLFGIIMNIIPILRECIFYFYHSKISIGTYFETQADLLQMNAYNLQQNDLRDPEERKMISQKQLAIVDLFRKIANKLTIDSKKAEYDTEKEIIKDDKKYKIDEIMDELPDSAASTLF